MDTASSRHLERVIDQARLLGSREQQSVTADDLL